MGKTPSELESEIEDLRHETDTIIDELERRANPSNVVNSVKTSVTDRATSMVTSVSDSANSMVEGVTQETPRVLERNQVVLGGAAAGALLGVVTFLGSALLGHSSMAYEQEIEPPRPLTPRERVMRFAAEATQKVTHFGSEAQDTLRHFGEEAGAVVPRFDRRATESDRRVESSNGGSGMLKRVLWMALASGMATLGSMLFKRMTAQVWKGTMHEEPPKG